MTEDNTDITTTNLFYIQSNKITKANLFEFDVSTMTGLYYPKIQAYNHSEIEDTKSYIAVDKIYAE